LPWQEIRGDEDRTPSAAIRRARLDWRESKTISGQRFS
jgi:hypothetical protein